MNTAAFFLNVIICTSPEQATCMPPQFMYQVPAGKPAIEREMVCNETAQMRNMAETDKARFYRCDAKKGA